MSASETMFRQSLGLTIILLLGLVVSVSGKIYERCELARELKYVHEVPDEQLATWVCIAEHESQYNTSAVGHLNGDGSGDHGIFQISDLYWCSPPGKGWACGLTCAELEDDDIEDDYICAKRIYKEHKLLSGDGFNAWAVYQPFCKGLRVETYTEECFVENDKSVTLRPRKKQVTKKLYPWQKPQQTMPLPSAHKTSGFPPKANSVLPTLTGSITSEDNEFSIVPRITGIPEFSTITEISPCSTNRPSSIVQGFTTSTAYVPRSSSGVISGTVKNTAEIYRFTDIVPKTEENAFFSSIPPKFVSSTSFLQAGKGVPNAKRRLYSSTQTSPDSSTSAPLQTPHTFPTFRRFAPHNSIAQNTYPTSPTVDGGIRHQSQRKRESVFIINGQIWT